MMQTLTTTEELLNADTFSVYRRAIFSVVRTCFSDLGFVLSCFGGIILSMLGSLPVILLGVILPFPKSQPKCGHIFKITVSLWFSKAKHSVS